MNLIENIQIFTRVAEMSSFTQAAEALNLPKASVSNAVQQLESKLETRLLHRTTRKVQLTQDGVAFYERSKDLIADADELQSMFQMPHASSLRGRVRIDMSSGFMRLVVMPKLPGLIQVHPNLSVEISSTERIVDLVSEGFDCVLRTGKMHDTSLIARPVGQLRQINCATPAYMAAHEPLNNLADLAQHQLVHFANTLGAKSMGFEYVDVDGNNQSLAMKGAVTVNSADAYLSACLAGMGIIQAPYFCVKDYLKQGIMVQVLPQFNAAPMPVTLLYANRRNLSKRVRVVMDWLVQIVQDYLNEKD
jgi:DNA-binding transcriptional LysR family regulator